MTGAVTAFGGVLMGGTAAIVIFLAVIFGWAAVAGITAAARRVRRARSMPRCSAASGRRDRYTEKGYRR